MNHRFLLLYTWFVRTVLFFLPDIPAIMRFRGWLYSLGMKKCGKNFQVAHSVILNSIEGLEVGNNVYFAMGNIIYASGKVTIGDEVMFGPNCLLTSGNHTYYNGSYRYGFPQEAKVIIEKGCWIAAHCVILPGSVLPARSVLAAGSVLTSKLKEKLSDALYTGIPARLKSIQRKA